MKLFLMHGIRGISNMAKSKIEPVNFDDDLPFSDINKKREDVKMRKQRALKSYARALRELEDCESILRDAWASISCIRGLIQEQTAYMTNNVELFEV